MNDLVHIPFHGGEVLAVMESGKPRIILRPAVEHIGLDYSWQLKKLKAKSWATVGDTPTVGADGRVREMASVDVRTFLMMLATVDERRVSEEAREVLVAYQNEVADVIEAHFMKGQTDGPRVGLLGKYGPLAVSFDEAMALYYEDRGYDFPTPFFTSVLRTAGFLRQAGCVPRRKQRRYFHFNGTSWQVRGWALPILFGKFEDTLRQFQRNPFEQPRLDDGLDEPVFTQARRSA